MTNPAELIVGIIIGGLFMLLLFLAMKILEDWLQNKQE
jgi:ABC-type nitrate/sulfonate/bicarbonate transport system permease component